ncbi:MAG: hypothetical protein ACI9XO_003407 [Paraglaciecola sp.]|jgi:hypothetical protein
MKSKITANILDICPRKISQEKYISKLLGVTFLITFIY